MQDACMSVVIPQMLLEPLMFIFKMGTIPQKRYLLDDASTSYVADIPIQLPSLLPLCLPIHTLPRNQKYAAIIQLLTFLHCYLQGISHTSYCISNIKYLERARN